MDWSKKRKSVDFLSIAKNTQPKRQIEFSFKSIYGFLKKLFAKRGLYFHSLNIVKKIKKIIYKQFFWGRGVYYKYSVAVAIFIILFPVTVFASSLARTDSNVKIQSNVPIDTDFDIGNGKSII
jgi:hypothetical protein